MALSPISPSDANKKKRLLVLESEDDQYGGKGQVLVCDSEDGSSDDDGIQVVILPQTHMVVKLNAAFQQLSHAEKCSHFRNCGDHLGLQASSAISRTLVLIGRGAPQSLPRTLADPFLNCGHGLAPLMQKSVAYFEDNRWVSLVFVKNGPHVDAYIKAIGPFMGGEEAARRKFVPHGYCKQANESNAVRSALDYLSAASASLGLTVLAMRPDPRVGFLPSGEGEACDFSAGRIAEMRNNLRQIRVPDAHQSAARDLLDNAVFAARVAPYKAALAFTAALSVDAADSCIQEADLDDPEPTWQPVPIKEDDMGGPHAQPMMAADCRQGAKIRMGYAWLVVKFRLWRSQICLVVLIMCVRWAIWEAHLQITRSKITYKDTLEIGFVRGKRAMQSRTEYRKWKRELKEQQKADQSSAQSSNVSNYGFVGA